MNKVVILAGGKGTRMGADVPKVLCEFAGVTIIESLLGRIGNGFGKPLAIVGYKAQQIKDKLGDRCDYVLQEQQLGTGHAIQCAKEFLENCGCEKIVVLPGDHPLVSKKTVKSLVAVQKQTDSKVVVATVKVPNFEGQLEGFWGFGRILRDKTGNVMGIIEMKDASPAQKEIRELNTSYYCFDAGWLFDNIDKLGSDNAAAEFYLTDMIGLAVRQGQKVAAYVVDDLVEAMGANTPEQLTAIDQALAAQ